MGQGAKNLVERGRARTSDFSDATKTGEADHFTAVDCQLVSDLCDAVAMLDEHADALEQLRSNERKAWREYIEARHAFNLLPVDTPTPAYRAAFDRCGAAAEALAQMGAFDQ